MILEAIYNGEFYPSEKVVPTSPAYIEALKTCEKLMEQLSRRLSKEDYALVEELQTQSSIAQGEESEYHWVTPKFCVKSNECRNRAKFICRRQRHDRLPPMSTT